MEVKTDTDNSVKQGNNSCQDQNSRNEKRHVSAQIKIEIQEMFDREMKVMSASMVLLLAVVIAVNWSTTSSFNACCNTNSHASNEIHGLHEKSELKALVRSMEKIALEALSNSTFGALSNDTQLMLKLLLLSFAASSDPIANYSAAAKHSWIKVAERGLVPTPYSISVVNDQLWSSCDAGGIVIYDLDLLRVVSITGLGTNRVKDVAQLSDGDVVIATGDGLFHFDSHSKCTFTC